MAVPVPPLEADARGVLEPGRLLAAVHFDRFAPSAALAGLVDRFWVADWDLPAHAPHEQHTLPHPVVNVVLEPGRARVYGVHRSRDIRLLHGRGRVVAAMFRPGGFRALLGRPVSSITDRWVPAAEVLGPRVQELSQELGDLSLQEAAGALDVVLRERAGPHVATHPVTPLAELAASDPSITRVEQLAHRGGLSRRQLQRTFADAVGVGPKWVIQRYRVLEAAERARTEERPDWAGVAQELGFCDQAHLVREFTRMVGVPPARYGREGLALRGSRRAG